jgi:hypothetical protein
MFANLAKEAVFDRIPLGGPGRIMADRDGQLVAIGQFFLQGVLPDARPSAVAAAAVS